MEGFFLENEKALIAFQLHLPTYLKITKIEKFHIPTNDVDDNTIYWPYIVKIKWCNKL